MSKQIDEKVVSMQFDNQQFEANVKQSMSTIEKLKQALKFDNTSKGFDNLNAAAKGVNMSPLSSGIEQVSNKFSAMEVIGVTALANITNSVVNTGKNLIKSLSIDQITSGWDKYTSLVENTQTIMNATGESIDVVNGYLNKMQWFSDETSYSMSEMNNALSTALATGTKYETAEKMIWGIAEATAYAGKTGESFTHVIRNLIQAYSKGKLQVTDWSSVELQGVNSQQLIQTLIDTGEALGKIRDGQVTLESFRDSLSTGWVDKDVMETTFTGWASMMEKAYELVQAGDFDTAADAIESLSGQFPDYVENATKAAQTAKTFREAIDATKDAVSSGWARTFQLFIGDYEQAKEVWTGLTNWLWDVFAAGEEVRNKIINSALGKSFTSIAEKVSAITKPAEKAAEAVKIVGQSLEEIENIANRVIIGEFGNGADRMNALAEAGINYYRVQNKVNETLGEGYCYTQDQIEAQDKLLGIQSESADAQDAVSKSTEDAIKIDSKLIATLAEKDDAELKSLGYTEDQIQAFRDLSKEADKVGMSLEDFLDNINDINGRWLILDSFKIVGDSIINTIDAIKTAWQEIFYGTTDEDTVIEKKAQMLYNVIAAIHKVTEYFKIDEERAEKLTRTFKGLFALVDLIATIVGGPLKIGFEVLKTVLSAFDLDILDVTASVGDAIVAFRDWIKSHLDLTEAITWVVDKVHDGIEAFKAWFDEFKNRSDVVEFAESLKDLSDKIRDIFSNLKKLENINAKDVWNALVASAKEVRNWYNDVGSNIVEGLVDGIKTGISNVFTVVWELGQSILQTLKDVLGIHSPSTEAEAIGEYTVEGYTNGLQNGTSRIAEVIKNFGNSILEFFSGLTFSKVLTGVFGGAMLAIMYKFGTALTALFAPMAGLGEIFSATASLISNSSKNINKILKSTSKVLKSFAFSVKAKALKDIAVAIAILVGSIMVLTKLKPGDVLIAIGLLVAIEAVVAALVFVISKLETHSVKLSKGGVEIKSIIPVLLSIGATLLMMAGAMAIIGSIKADKFGNAIHGFLIALAGITAIIAAYGTLVKGKTAANIKDFGKAMRKLSVSFLLFAGVLKIIGSMTPTEIWTGAGVLTAFGLYLVGMAKIAKLAKKSLNSFGNMILRFSTSVILLIGAIKLIGMLEDGEIIRGMEVLSIFGIFTALLCKLMSLIDKDIPTVGKAILSLAASMILLAATVKIISGIEWDKMDVVAVGMAGLLAVVAVLVEIMKHVEKDAPKMAVTLMAMAAAIGILGGIAALLGLMDSRAMLQGLGCVLLLSVFIGVLILCTKEAAECKGTIIALAVVIGILAASVTILSLLPTTGIVAATLAIIAVLGMLAVALHQTKNIPKDSTKSFVAIAVAIGILAAALVGLSFIPWKQLAIAAAALSAIMLAFAFSIKIISGSLQSMDVGSIAKMALFAVAIIGLAAAMSLLAKVPWQSLVAGAGAIALIIAAIVLASYLMTGAAAGAAIFVVALLGVSTAILICSAGFYVFSLALAGIAVALPLLGDGFIVLGNGIYEFVTKVASAKDQISNFVEVVIAIGSTMLTTLLQIALGLVAAAGGAVLLGAGAVVLGAGLVIAGAGMLVAAAGLALLAGAIYILCAAASAGMEMVVTTMASLGETSYQAGYYLVAGFGLGIIDGLTAIVEACGNLVSTVANTICGLLGIHSPSTVAQLWGLFTGQGFAQGLTDSQGEVETSGKGLFGKLKGLFTSDKSAETDSSSKGKAVASSFTEGLASGFDTSKIAEMLGTQGSEAGSNFSTGLAEGFNLDSIQNMLSGDSIDFSQFQGMMSQNGEDSAEDFSTALDTGLTDGLDTSVSDVRAYNPKFKEAGKYLVQGFASGIAENTYLAKAKSAAMAKAAYNAAKAQLDINSPSKVFRKLAYAIPEGFAQGIDRRTWMAEQSAEDMANTAIRGTSNALARISDAINSDVDTQPTIRPVIDLSDVSSGAAAINSMLGMTPSVGVSANLRSINSMMNSRQNGTVSDIVSAIKDLGDAQSTGNTYNINGITYDDGSNVSNAIATLVRAAKVERRV